MWRFLNSRVFAGIEFGHVLFRLSAGRSAVPG